MMMCHFLRTVLGSLGWLMPGFGPPISTDSSLIFERAAVTWLRGSDLEATPGVSPVGLTWYY